MQRNFVIANETNFPSKGMSERSRMGEVPDKQREETEIPPILAVLGWEKKMERVEISPVPNNGEKMEREQRISCNRTLLKGGKGTAPDQKGRERRKERKKRCKE